MRRALIVVVAIAALLAAACGNSESSSGDDASDGSGDGDQVTVDQPGVTDTEIRTGVVASATNPLGGDYATIADGVEAYFAKVNSEGGVHGRDLVVAAERDDQSANNQAEVQAMLSQDDVFAVFVATLLFTGADLLADAGTPTFGFAINQEWAGPDNLFGSEGSYLCFSECELPLLPYIAQELGAEKVGTLAYNVPQSTMCSEGMMNSFEKYPTAEVAFVDTSLPYGTADYAADVTRMKEEGVELVQPCMDFNGVNALLQEMRRQDFSPTMYLPNSYNHDFIAEFGELYENAIIRTPFAPFETENPPQGLADFLEWMEEIGAEPTEPAAAGWITAHLFVDGLLAAGEDFTQQSVVDAINSGEDFTAEGFIEGVRWPDEHTGEHPEDDCSALSEVVGNEFQPHSEFARSDAPFICFPRGPDGLVEPTFR